MRHKGPNMKSKDKTKSVGKDSIPMLKSEINFMVKNKAPKEMIKHEKEELKEALKAKKK